MTMPLSDDVFFIDARALLPMMTRDGKQVTPRGLLTDTQAAAANVIRMALPHWHPDNLAGALIYSFSDGWYADILLHLAPECHSTVLDRGEGQPFATRREAEDFLSRFVIALTATWAQKNTFPMRPPEISRDQTQGMTQSSHSAPLSKVAA